MVSDDYVRVLGKIEAVRKGAVMFSVGKSVPRAAWIPRSLIHGADDLTLDGRMVGEECALRIREWKADEVGFNSQRDDAAADGDLFRSGDVL